MFHRNSIGPSISSSSAAVRPAAMMAGATVRDLAEAIHAFPTFAEGLKVAAGEWLNARQQVEEHEQR